MVFLNRASSSKPVRILRGYLAQLHADSMASAIVYESNRWFGHGNTVQFNSYDARADVFRILDHDLVLRGVIAVSQAVVSPVLRDRRFDSEFIATQLEAKNVLEPHTVGPTA